MEEIINKKHSFLFSYKYNNKELIDLCVIEVDKYLQENPKVLMGQQHRNIGFFSDKSIGYYYSGQLSKSIPITENLKILLNEINNIYKTKYNGVLVNKYKDGNDFIGAHSDDEKYLDDNGVMILSYGAIRNFRIRNKFTKDIIKEIPTIPYNILHMGGDFQKIFTHEIPSEKKIKESRVSFTFRHHIK